MSMAISGKTMTLFKSGNVYYFGSEYHKRKGVLVQKLAIVYDPNEPDNAQASDAPPPPLPQTGGILLLVTGGITTARPTTITMIR